MVAPYMDMLNSLRTCSNPTTSTLSRHLAFSKLSSPVGSNRGQHSRVYLPILLPICTPQLGGFHSPFPLPLLPHALLPPQFGSNSLLAHPQSACRVAEHTLLHARACHESIASTVSHARSRRVSLWLRAAPQAGPFPLVWGSQTRQAAPADPDQPPCQVACAPELCFDSI